MLIAGNISSDQEAKEIDFIAKVIVVRMNGQQTYWSKILDVFYIFIYFKTKEE